jgi:hypothetical protein
MLIHYTLQNIAKGHKKWTTLSCIDLSYGHYDPFVFCLVFANILVD